MMTEKASLKRQGNIYEKSLSTCTKKLRREHTVLVVDDSPTVSKVVSQMLQSTGYNVDVVHSGVDAMSRLKQRSYDIVIMDINMPDMSGLDTAKMYREYEQNGTTFKRQIIIGMTGSSSDSTIRQVLDNGMDCFLLKPFSLKKFEQLDILQPFYKTNTTITSVIANEHQNGHHLNNEIALTNIPVTPQKLPQPSSTCGSNLSILVVDDSPTVLKIVSKMLVKAGHTVKTCQSGKSALDELKESVYDVVLMDINMPEMGGLETSFEFRIYEFEQAVQQRPDQKKIKIIAMTAEVTTSLAHNVMTAGFDGLLSKPFRIEKFTEVWNNINNSVYAM